MNKTKTSEIRNILQSTHLGRAVALLDDLGYIRISDELVETLTRIEEIDDMIARTQE